jgi:hypothetical protein
MAMDNVAVHGCGMQHSERPRRHFKRMLFYGGEDGYDGRNFLSEFIKYSTTVTMFVVSISTTFAMWSNCKRTCSAGHRQMLSDK